MYTQCSEKYRLEGNKLFKIDASGLQFIFCATVPARIKGLKAAIAWYEADHD